MNFGQQQYFQKQQGPHQAYYSVTFDDQKKNENSQDIQGPYKTHAESKDGASLYNKVSSLVSFGQGKKFNNQPK